MNFTDLNSSPRLKQASSPNERASRLIELKESPHDVTHDSYKGSCSCRFSELIQVTINRCFRSLRCSKGHPCSSKLQPSLMQSLRKISFKPGKLFIAFKQKLFILMVQFQGNGLSCLYAKKVAYLSSMIKGGQLSRQSNGLKILSFLV